MVRELRVGIIGWGLAGRCFHGGFVQAVEGLKLTTVATSRDVDTARFGNIAIVPDPEAVVAADVDLVVVASPNREHVRHAALALAGGKHVVVEKPLARTVAELRALITQARTADRLLVPFQNRRWDGDFLTVKKLIDDGTFGPIHSFESRWPAYRPVPRQRSAWKAEADPMHGVLYDLGPHLIDQTLVLFGAPERVEARVQVLRDGGTNVDRFRLRLGYVDGPDVTIEVDQLDPTDHPRFVVRGRDATFIKMGVDAQEQLIRADRSPTEPGWGVDDPERYGRLITPKGERRVPTEVGDYRHFYRQVYDAIVDAKETPVDPQDVVTQLSVIEVALRSTETNREVLL